MKPLSLTIATLVALCIGCAPLSAFDLGSCLVFNISDSSTPELEKVSITVKPEVFNKAAVSKSVKIAQASDFIEAEEATESFSLADSESESETSSSPDGTDESTFSFDEPSSAFSTSSPFESSPFTLD